MTLSVEERAMVLVEALPYIKRFHGQIVVVKVGGKAMEQAKDETLQDVVLLRYVRGLPGSYFPRQKFGYLRHAARLMIAHDLLQPAFAELLSGLVFRFTHTIRVNQETITSPQWKVIDRIIRSSVHAED